MPNSSSKALWQAACSRNSTTLSPPSPPVCKASSSPKHQTSPTSQKAPTWCNKNNIFIVPYNPHKGITPPGDALTIMADFLAPIHNKLRQLSFSILHQFIQLFASIFHLFLHHHLIISACRSTQKADIKRALSFHAIMLYYLYNF